MKLSALNDRVYVCQGDVEPDQIRENAGFVISERGVVVIDTTRSLFNAAWLYQQIRAVTDQDIAYVVNTHFHADHVFGNQIFPAPAIASQLCKERMRSLLSSDWTSENVRKLPWVAGDPGAVEGLRVVLPEITFNDALALELGAVEMQITYLGGHTPGSSVVLLPQDRLLFIGDLLFVGRYPAMVHCDLERWISALDRVLAMDVVKVVPGHGPVGTLEQVKEQKSYFVDLRDRVTTLAEQGMSREEIVSHPGFPRYAERVYGIHPVNIGIAYDQLMAG